MQEIARINKVQPIGSQGFDGYIFFKDDDMKEKTVCFTGHREIPMLQKHGITKRLRKTLVELIEQGYCYFGAGGALGFDTMAAQTVLDLKEKYPQIKLILVLPCKSQADSWPESDKRMYEYIMSQADKIKYTSEHYYRGCMHTRNRHLVDNSSVCICYLTKNTGGTAYTVKYATEHSLKIYNVASK